jgi:hypothetical protein
VKFDTWVIANLLWDLSACNFLDMAFFFGPLVLVYCILYMVFICGTNMKGKIPNIKIPNPKIALEFGI